MKRRPPRLYLFSAVALLGIASTAFVLHAICGAAHADDTSNSSGTGKDNFGADNSMRFKEDPSSAIPQPSSSRAEPGRLPADGSVQMIFNGNETSRPIPRVDRISGDASRIAAAANPATVDPFAIPGAKSPENSSSASTTRFKVQQTAAEAPTSIYSGNAASVNAAPPAAPNRFSQPNAGEPMLLPNPIDQSQARPLNAAEPAAPTGRFTYRPIEPQTSANSPGASAPVAHGNSLWDADRKDSPRAEIQSPPSIGIRPEVAASPSGGPDGSGLPGDHALEGAQAAKLTIEKIAPHEIQVGKPTLFQIKIRNVGSIAAQGVEIHDAIPKGTQLLATAPGATQGAQGELTWTIGTINAGAEVIAKMELMPVAEGEIGSVANVTMRTDASVRTIATRPQLALQISAPQKVMIGEPVHLTIKITNPGTGAANGIIVTEHVPGALRHPAGSELEFEVGTLKPGETRQVDLSLTAAQAGQVVNTLTARGEANLHAEEHADFTVVSPGLSVAMNGPSRRYLERQATYTVSVSNPGTAPAQDVELVTQLPRGMKFVKANNSGHYDPQLHTVTWNLEELPPSETGSVTLVAVPMEAGQQQLRVQGKAKQGLSDSKEQTVLVEGVAAVDFHVTHTDDPIEVGGETTYQVQVTNQGSKGAANIQLAAELPPELRPIDAIGPTKAAIAGQHVQFETLGQLDAKGSVMFKIRAKSQQAGDLRVKFQLSTDEMRQPITQEDSTRVYADH